MIWIRKIFFLKFPQASEAWQKPNALHIRVEQLLTAHSKTLT